MRMRHIVISGLSGSAVFFPHYLTNGTILIRVTEHEMCDLIFFTNFYLKHFSRLAHDEKARLAQA